MPLILLSETAFDPSSQIPRSRHMPFHSAGGPFSCRPIARFASESSVTSESLSMRNDKNGRCRSSDSLALSRRGSEGSESVVTSEKSTDLGICISLSARWPET